MHFNIKYILLIPLMLAAFVGCGPSEREQPAEQEQEYHNVPLHRQDSTNHYKYDLKLPGITRTHKALRDTLTTLAEQSQQSFIARAGKDTLPSERPPWELQLHFTVEDSTQHFISVLGEGYEYTGGAHGMPFYITLAYDVKNKEFVELRDMLGDSTALRPVSEYVQKQLPQQLRTRGTSVNQEWLNDGTSPSYSNYKNVLVQPQGLRIIFGAYQVGPYAIGTPEVDVPVSVFQEELDPTYDDWFKNIQR